MPGGRRRFRPHSGGAGYACHTTRDRAGFSPPSPIPPCSRSKCKVNGGALRSAYLVGRYPGRAERSRADLGQNTPVTVRGSPMQNQPPTLGLADTLVGYSIQWDRDRGADSARGAYGDHVYNASKCCVQRCYRRRGYCRTDPDGIPAKDCHHAPIIFKHTRRVWLATPFQPEV